MKQKLLKILMPALFLFLGLILGSLITKLGTEKPKTDNGTKQTSPSSSGEQPQSETSTNSEVAAETYTVQTGDTLFGISIKFNVQMDDLAQLNGITDANQIKVGQVLKIPKTGASATNKETKLIIDQAKMQELQALVDGGEQSWRLDPVEVVKAISPASFEFSAVDTFTLKSKDDTNGLATVNVKKTKDSKIYTYEVSLVQPVKKGKDGIWAITLIKEIS